jgi:hypothetical protein
MAAGLALLDVPPVSAALTPAQRKELAAIRSELSRIHLPIKREAIGETEQKLDQLEQRVARLAAEADLKEGNSVTATAIRMIATRRDAVAKARAKEEKGPKKKSAAPGGEPQAGPSRLPAKNLIPGVDKIPKPDPPRASGSETVSFSRDIAPFMVERCLRCHSGPDPKGGLSLETFEKLMAGGKSGPVIEPGNLAKSRMWDLVGEQKPFKMPPGDALITRTHHRNLRTWIAEGARYDGDNPRTPLRDLVPSQAAEKAAALARLTPAVLREKRRDRSEERWRRAFPKEPAQKFESASFLLYGNVPAARLEEAARAAEDDFRAIQTYFEERPDPILKGGLTLFVLKDRASFEEFSEVVLKRQPPAPQRGYAVVGPEVEDAFIVVEETPAAERSGQTVSARANIVENLTAAFLTRSEKKTPDWLVLGTGRVLARRDPARRSDPPRRGGTAPFPKSAPATGKPAANEVYRLAGSLDKPQDVFNDGSFSPAAAATVGAALVEFMVEQRGQPAFVRFVKLVVGGTSQEDAFRQVYGVEMRDVASGFLTAESQKDRSAE